jgi:hypothetical protein
MNVGGTGAGPPFFISSLLQCMSLASERAPRQTGGVISRAQHLARHGRSQMLRDEILRALDHVLHL